MIISSETMRDEYLRAAAKVISDPYILVNVVSRRVKQLRRGSRPLVETNLKDNMKIVLQEILQDKIFLDANSNVRAAGEIRAPGEGMELDFGD